MVDVGVWADDVRNERKETGPWHHVNIPLEADQYDEACDGRHGHNIIHQIEKFEKVLVDKSKPQAERVKASEVPDPLRRGSTSASSRC